MNRIVIPLYCFIYFLNIQVYSQFLKAPPDGNNQQSIISQKIGNIVDITVTYSSPDVNGRKGEIWNNLVPHGKVWRAGANENTTIAFSHNVKINGFELAAGTYGLFMIPDAEEWTIIFSNNSTSWGTFVYDTSEDTLRIKTKARSNHFTEWLNYTFIEKEPSHCVLALEWESLLIPFKIEVDIHDIVIESFKKQLNGAIGLFSYEGSLQAANYCLVNNTHLEQGLNWVEQSIDIGANFNNTIIKYELLKKLNKNIEAKSTYDFALTLGTPQELYYYGRKLIREKKLDEAFNVLNTNFNKYGDTIWPTHLGMGRIYDALENKKKALKHYRKALKMAKLKRQQASINKLIERIGR